MHQTEEERLILMINQIAINNSRAGSEEAIANVIHLHITKFWSRRMKQQLHDYIERDGQKLHPAALIAGQRLEATV
jgi:formate dehydrogenase subunit delta